MYDIKPKQYKRNVWWRDPELMVPLCDHTEHKQRPGSELGSWGISFDLDHWNQGQKYFLTLVWISSSPHKEVVLTISDTTLLVFFNANCALNIEVFGQTMDSYDSMRTGSVLRSVPFPWIPNLLFDAGTACINNDSCQLRFRNFTCDVRTGFLPHVSLHIHLHWIPPTALWHSHLVLWDPPKTLQSCPFPFLPWPIQPHQLSFSTFAHLFSHTFYWFVEQ